MKRRLIDVFPDWLSSVGQLVSVPGIFTTLSGLPEAATRPWFATDYKALDYEYYGNHSGRKTISPLLDMLAPEDGAVDVTKLSDVIFKHFLDKWDRLYAIYKAEYEPLENYSMTETETPNLHRSSTNYQTTDASSSVYGFNSSTPVPQGESTGTTHGESTSNFEDETGTRTLTRSGNIGVTTSQQMAESEIALWKWNFYEQIFQDLDKILTIPIY